MGIVRFALRFPHTFYVLAILIVFLGVTAIVTTSKDIFPQIKIPVVTVIWQYTGLSTQEMEVRVATYSEYSISSSVTGIRNIESQTLEGIVVEKVYFQPEVNSGAELTAGLLRDCSRTFHWGLRFAFWLTPKTKRP
jgi:multidrug efflux pump subunit AcrB